MNQKLVEMATNRIRETGRGNRDESSLLKVLAFEPYTYFTYSEMKLHLKEWKKPSIQIECKDKQMSITMYQIDNLTTETTERK